MKMLHGLYFVNAHIMKNSKYNLQSKAQKKDQKI
jgi:hypothetical protein